MRPDYDNQVLIVTNGLNGKVETYNDFFKHPVFIQEEILSSVIMPILLDSKSVHISIGYKN